MHPNGPFISFLVMGLFWPTLIHPSPKKKHVHYGHSQTRKLCDLSLWPFPLAFPFGLAIYTFNKRILGGGLWDKSPVLLGTAWGTNWELHWGTFWKYIGNMMGTTKSTKFSKPPPFFLKVFWAFLDACWVGSWGCLFPFLSWANY
jgi:hypothetical protein